MCIYLVLAYILIYMYYNTTILQTNDKDLCCSTVQVCVCVLELGYQSLFFSINITRMCAHVLSINVIDFSI